LDVVRYYQGGELWKKAGAEKEGEVHHHGRSRKLAGRRGEVGKEGINAKSEAGGGVEKRKGFDGIDFEKGGEEN